MKCEIEKVESGYIIKIEGKTYAATSAQLAQSIVNKYFYKTEPKPKKHKL